MITVKHLADYLELHQFTDVQALNTPVTDGCVCDLLSWVMAHAEQGAAWITVRTHPSVVAVACLCGCACVIIPDGITVPQATIARADGEGVPIFGSPRTAYSLCCGICSLGIGS